MSFANIGSLLWVLPLAGVIIALYLLKMRRKDLRVPATFLWPPLVYEIRANSLFQKLKFSWLLFLQLLAVILVVFGLAEPQMRQQGLGGAVTVVVLDSSASMSATDVSPSRFDKATGILNNIIEQVKSGDKLALVEAGPTPKVIFPLSSDIGKMRSALRSVEPTDSEGDVGEALRLAATITAKKEGARIILLSDGVFPEIENFNAESAPVVFEKIGSSAKNVAVSALGIADSNRGPQLFCGVKNYGLDAAKGTLTLYADGKSFDSVNYEVRPNQTYGHSRPVPVGAKVIEARLESSDILKADDYGVALATPGATLKVLLVSRGNIFLERALALDPRVILDKASTIPDQGQWDVVVFDGVAEQAVNAKAVLNFGSSGRTSIVSKQGSLSKPSIGTIEPGSLLSSVGLDGAYVDEAESIMPHAEGKVQATFSNGKPAVVTSDSGGKRSVYVAFEPLKSDFPLQVGFPIFVANALEYLVPKAEQSQELVVTAGRTISFGATDDSLSLTGPTGNHTIRPTAGRHVIREATKVGEYKLGGRRMFAALRSEVESNVGPRDQVLLGGKKIDASGTVMRLAGYWRFIVLLALFVLGCEWWLFMRRS
ncbi:MAG: BatA and WFA domain-containing protein [Fimbriimonadaceae bacterium]